MDNQEVKYIDRYDLMFWDGNKKVFYLFSRSTNLKSINKFYSEFKRECNYIMYITKSPIEKSKWDEIQNRKQTHFKSINKEVR